MDSRVSIRARHCWRAMLSPGSALNCALRFQSAPAIAGGRCACATACARTTAGFNPRPPLLAGDAAMAVAWYDTMWVFQSAPAIAGGRCRGEVFAQLQILVSIRARHCWRAMRATQANAMAVEMFQSAPAIAGGRCTCALRSCCAPTSFNPRPPLLAGDARRRRVTARVESVSIRARHCWRAMRCCTSLAACAGWFQSAPAIAGGRCNHCCGTPRISNAFQSAPAIAGGRCDMAFPSRSSASRFQSAPAIAGGRCGGALSAIVGAYVSIRARHCWRAMRASAACTTSKPGFNPRPPLLAGDAERLVAGAAALFVSIRARHCWRAMRTGAQGGGGGVEVSIRARHCWRAMRYQPSSTTDRKLFQSAPAIAGGRCRSRARGASRGSRFNPRPPLLAGDARSKSAAPLTAPTFQSAPAIAGGRCRRWRCRCCGSARFNPRPPLLAGDA